MTEPDRAIQVHGALARCALADGPDEVHRILIAKNVLAAYHRGESWDFGS